MTTILIVEDSTTLAQLAIKSLKHGGFDSMHVTSGTEALQSIDNMPLDLILLDLNLPDISGWNVLDHARSRNPATIIIVMTTEDEPEQHGADLYLVKPVMPNDLIAIVRDALRDG
jgi:DNA-binding response OmpR family regulator